MWISKQTCELSLVITLTGDKLKWLQNQAFEFFEVEAKNVQESLDGHVTVINQKNDHRLCGECVKRISEECVKRISEEKRMDKERLEAQTKRAVDVRHYFSFPAL